jgi:hypothetical protein
MIAAGPSVMPTAMRSSFVSFKNAVPSILLSFKIPKSSSMSFLGNLARRPRMSCSVLHPSMSMMEGGLAMTELPDAYEEPDKVKDGCI